MFKQTPEHADTAGTPVAALLDEGVIDRWARLFATRFQAVERTAEFASRIVGAIAESPLVASSVISSDEDLARVFDHSRRAIEEAMGRPVFTVAASVRPVAAAKRQRAMSPTGCEATQQLVLGHVAA